VDVMMMAITCSCTINPLFGREGSFSM